MKNYYSILGINFASNSVEIKKQYKLLAKKWHPDVNPLSDTTGKMQELTEAYFILNNERSKFLYDIYYASEQKKHKEQTNQNTQKDNRQESFYYSTDLNEELAEWIIKARTKAKDYVLQTFQIAKGATTEGCRTAGKAIFIGIAFIILIIIIGLIARLFR